MEKLQILSVNVRGLNSDEKRQKLYEWLKLSQCDVILLQETHFIEKMSLNIIPDGMGKFFIHLAIPHTVKVFQCFFGKT